VYHYTTDEGFKGIIESQELWATSIYHLNDWKEFVYGRDAFIESAEILLNSEKAVDAATQLLSYLFDTHPPLFVCSFSAAGDGDDLSQWRAYSPRGGYAIGFPLAKLLTHAGTLRFDVLQCEYGTTDASRFVEGLAKIMEQIFEMAGGVDGFRSQFPFNDPSKDGLLAMLLKFVARYKHDAFRAEEEWRLVHLLALGEDPRFKMSDSTSVPYVGFNLKNEELWKQAQIVMSPCLPDAAKLRQESVRLFLDSELTNQNLPTDCARRVRLSSAPYRIAMGGG
jgi:hypothetical protein